MVRSTKFGFLVLLCAWGLVSCGDEEPETVTGSSAEESGWTVAPSALFHPDGEAAAHIFDRNTFQRVQAADLAPDRRYILGAVKPTGKIYWQEDFDPSAEQLYLPLWTAPPAPRNAASKALASTLRGDFDGSGKVDQTDVIFLFAWLAAQIEFPSTQIEAGDIDDDGDTDWMDLAILGAYAYADPRPRSNPHGIGEPLQQPLIGRLEPIRPQWTGRNRACGIVSPSS